MPSTAKDSLLESTTTAGTAKTEKQGSQPSDSVGAEIPITVHASRYSAAAKGAAKLPPVHEETRTVIIFQQGAVVRLSATVTPGELVVLTNNRSGADVICRVTSVKTQPGIQNYVNLEFTQRAVSFWEEPRQSERAHAAENPPLAAVSPGSTPPAPTPITTGYKAPSSPVPQVQPVSRPSVPAAAAKPISAQSLKVSSLADAPEKSREAAEQAPAPPQIPEITPSPAFSNKQPHVLPSRTPRLESFDSVSPRENKGSKNIVLIVTAAVVLLAIGAVGGALFLRWNREAAMTQQPSTAPAQPAAAIPAPVPATPAPAAPIFNASGKSNSVDSGATISTSARNAGPSASLQPVPARLAVETPKVEVRAEEPPQSAPQPVTRPNINLGKISAPSIKTVKVNSVEAPPVLPSDVNALPAGINENVVNTEARNNPVAPPAPPQGAAITGGQFQQPKLISSVAAVYPATAKAARVQGDVIVDALVDATGKVTATKVITGPPLLQQAAINSLRLWNYEPARLNGQPIAIHVRVNITFHLQ